MKFLELLKRRNILFEIKGDTLIVFEDVYLSNSELKELPNYSMVFLGNVDLSHTQIKEFPAYPIRFCGSLDLSHTQIEELPDNIIIIDYLDISHTPIKELPVCIVKGSLNIRQTSITKIPKDLIAYRIYTPFKGELDIYIEKIGIIGIGYNKNIKEVWELIFKEKMYRILTPEQFDIVEQDFKTAVKLLESWNS